MEQIMNLVTSQNIDGNTLIKTIEELTHFDFSVFATVGAAISIVIGLLGCFLGFKLLKFWISFFGFFIGGTIGYFIMSSVQDKTSIVLIGTLMIAVLSSFLSYKLYLLGVFFLCGILGGVIAYELLPVSPQYLALLATLIGIIVGIAAVKYLKPIVIISTSLGNAIIVVNSAMNLMEIHNNTMVYAIGAALGVAGMMFQFATNRKKKNIFKNK